MNPDTLVRRNFTHAIGCVAAALVAAIGSCLIAEMVEINRIVRTLIHRDFGLYELVFSLSLWVCMAIFLYSQKNLNGTRLISFLIYGLAAGILCGLIAASSLTFFSHRSAAFLRSLSEDAVGYIGFAIIATFGWLIGTLSGLLSFA
jgi:hypothetical protein